jgi:hypothetical protein
MGERNAGYRIQLGKYFGTCPNGKLRKLQGSNKGEL